MKTKVVLSSMIALIALAGFKMFGQKVLNKVKDQAGKVEQIGN